MAKVADLEYHTNAFIEPSMHGLEHKYTITDIIYIREVVHILLILWAIIYGTPEPLPWRKYRPSETTAAE